MNRRSFIGLIAASPVVAVAGFSAPKNTATGGVAPRVKPMLVGEISLPYVVSHKQARRIALFNQADPARDGLYLA